ncbi:hypothetical protein E2C01_008927 [Portunus trituberculatus]|uniref:Uncharacterized protein n=1 Tax=Portunus trituberculatus TaxID=210409 RepID=A0A5B7D467_PORTR|nr:hypothetical protein [Portunus trituberculatus]
MPSFSVSLPLASFSSAMRMLRATSTASAVSSASLATSRSAWYKERKLLFINKKSSPNYRQMPDPIDAFFLTSHNIIG